MNSEDKKVFFELGISFARFSAMPDEDEHEIICQVASRLELKIPDYNELLMLVTDGEVVAPPREWFEGSDGISRRNYGRIGTLSFAIFLQAKNNVDISDAAVQELMALFRAETIPTNCLDDYLGDLKTSDAAGAFRGFWAAFCKAIQNDPRDNEPVCEQISDGKIFVVHGHDEGAKHKIARFIENLGLIATILDEEPSKGQTIIE